MMDYGIFKEVVKETFLSYMPESYQDMEVRVEPVQKVNRKLDGLCLFAKNEKMGASPTLYINDIYQHYLKTEDLQETLQAAAEVMDEVFSKIKVPPLDISAAKDHIIFQLVNTIQNEEMLKDMPHREFQDLSIIYRWVAGVDGNGIGSSMINNYLAETLGMGEEQLFKAAAENTRRILPPTVESVDKVIREMCAAEGMPPEMAEMLISEIPPEMDMWIISNVSRKNGAASMLYEDELHKLSVQLGTDLFILPSSIHEVLAIPANGMEPEELAQQVSEINMEKVVLEERLSNQVYYYDKELRKLSLATDMPNKRLDGIVAEQGIVYETKQSR